MKILNCLVFFNEEYLHFYIKTWNMKNDNKLETRQFQIITSYIFFCDYTVEV